MQVWVQIQRFCFKWKFIQAAAVLVLAQLNSMSARSGRNPHNFEDGLTNLYLPNKQTRIFGHLRQERSKNLTTTSISTTTTSPLIGNLGIGSLALRKVLAQSRQMMYTPAQVAEAMMLCQMGQQLIAAMMASQAQIMMVCQIAMMGGGGAAAMPAAMMMPAAAGAAPAAAGAPAGAAAPAGSAPAAMAATTSGSGLGLKDLLWLGAGATGSVLALGTLGFLAAMVGMSEVRRSSIADQFNQDEETLQNIYSLTRRCQYSGVGCFDTDPVLAATI